MREVQIYLGSNQYWPLTDNNLNNDKMSVAIYHVCILHFFNKNIAQGHSN